MVDPAGTGPVEAVFREKRGRLLAILAARVRDLDLAEEVASEAIEAALRRWPVDGVPHHPLSWLVTTARRKAIDRIRRDRTYAARLAELHLEAAGATATEPHNDDELPDERLELFFTCCHPALPFEAQIALTLRFLAGLSHPRSPRLSWSHCRPWRSGSLGPNARSVTPAFRSGSRANVNSATGSRRCCASSTSSSARVTVPATAAACCEPISAWMHRVN